MKDPVDHARTTRPHAGESFKDGTNAPGLVAVALAVATLVVSLYFFASGQTGTGGVTLVIAAVLGVGGGAWLFVRHRRIRSRELDYLHAHPGEPRTPPTS
ncbi:LPXTG cell wall anchor domain-containing protein [Mycolicibacterium mucogenicum]|uniref:LPXTG cell wall anchor domain-containing protein n=1 Tax=Mycolicibacterium mucogenicum TaxID=56689 RepID=A0A4R5WH08_MYCMU|nr:LPXTG cell wall anchor domain-containing protein [Mycolicibacterium mucogenicum]MCX8557786.1 LPXTG cell wall anchor domain-containing protein [Mycolicibacterium mucogenicum]TDK89527.1 LPXTG cell wall anchor domain-containing protein [Mycolicibacterium mucogenicum]